MSLNSITGPKCWCPKCKHKTQAKLLEWLKLEYADFSIETEVSFAWSLFPKTNKKCRYDFYIRELEVLVELDGRQHFEQVSNWEDPNSVRERDCFKNEQAIKHHKRVIRLLQDDVLNENIEWRSELRRAINDDRTSLICIGERYKTEN
jgi:hypothetical protein